LAGEAFWAVLQALRHSPLELRCYGSPSSDLQGPRSFRIDEALARYRLVLSNPRSFVCFAVVFLEGLAIYGITPVVAP
jgi:hypothetical protein